jgi:hypothetical protein
MIESHMVRIIGSLKALALGVTKIIFCQCKRKEFMYVFASSNTL